MTIRRSSRSGAFQSPPRRDPTLRDVRVPLSNFWSNASSQRHHHYSPPPLRHIYSFIDERSETITPPAIRRRRGGDSPRTLVRRGSPSLSPRRSPSLSPRRSSSLSACSSSGESASAFAWPLGRALRLIPSCAAPSCAPRSASVEAVDPSAAFQALPPASWRGVNWVSASGLSWYVSFFEQLFCSPV
jgi:hypothetical protein